jgi:MFS superfamily sulfate permease-like transporter
MAFAISSGLSPGPGLYCAVVTGFLISALGDSRFQIGGPTGVRRRRRGIISTSASTACSYAR